MRDIGGPRYPKIMGNVKMANSLGFKQAGLGRIIVAYGKKSGFSAEMVNLAVKVAFIESSLGQSTSNGIEGNTSKGLYQYNDDQWDVSGMGGDVNSDDDQIAAFYNDIRKYTVRYNLLPPATKSGLSVEQYIYIKHHDGPNARDFVNSEGRSIFDKCSFEPPKDTSVTVINP
jgi:hypothetical protein